MFHGPPHGHMISGEASCTLFMCFLHLLFPGSSSNFSLPSLNNEQSVILLINVNKCENVFYIYMFVLLIVFNMYCVCLSGWITALAVLRSNIPVSVFMMVVAVFFTVNAVLSVVLLKMVRTFSM